MHRIWKIRCVIYYNTREDMYKIRWRDLLTGSFAAPSSDNFYFYYRNQTQEPRPHQKSRHSCPVSRCPVFGYGVHCEKTNCRSARLARGPFFHSFSLPSEPLLSVCFLFLYAYRQIPGEKHINYPEVVGRRHRYFWIIRNLIQDLPCRVSLHIMYTCCEILTKYIQIHMCRYSSVNVTCR